MLTFFSLVIGELVPKRIGLLHREALARFAARPMHLLARAMSPIVHVLGFTTDIILRLVGVRPSGEPSVSEEEITGMVHEGMRAGVFLPSEGPMVERAVELFGEAVSRLPRDLTKQHPDIPRREIVGMRNRLIHGYDGVDYDILWDVLQNFAPNLLGALPAVMESSLN